MLPLGLAGGAPCGAQTELLGFFFYQLPQSVIDSRNFAAGMPPCYSRLSIAAGLSGVLLDYFCTAYIKLILTTTLHSSDRHHNDKLIFFSCFWSMTGLAPTEK
jgi:hypothetical protein